MTLFRQVLAAVLLLGLAACGGPDADAPQTPTEPASAPPSGPATISPTQVEEGPVVALAPDGLTLVAPSGSTRQLVFGLGKVEAVEILAQAEGVSGQESANPECGAGPMVFVEWPDGLTALFQEDRFVGWSVGHGASRKLTTMNGVGIGATRSQLTAAFSGATVEETTLGQEFAAGGLSGILTGPGANDTVDAIWAGTSCVFR